MTVTVQQRNIALVAARIVAGLFGAAQLAGIVFFVVLAPEEAVWVGLWLDAPIVALMLTTTFLKLAVALAPGLSVERRIAFGLIAVAVGVATTLVKIPVYDEPEGIGFIMVDLMLLALLLIARRGAVRH